MGLTTETFNTDRTNYTGLNRGIQKSACPAHFSNPAASGLCPRNVPEETTVKQELEKEIAKIQDRAQPVDARYYPYEESNTLTCERQPQSSATWQSGVGSEYLAPGLYAATGPGPGGQYLRESPR